MGNGKKNNFMLGWWGFNSYICKKWQFVALSHLRILIKPPLAMKHQHFYILTCLCVFLLMPIDGWAQKKGKKGSAKTATPTVKFNAFDPFDKVNDQTKGTPWEKTEAHPLELLPGVKAAIPEPLPHVSQMSLISYNMAVSQAFESLRLVYGEMTEEQAKALNEVWAPLYNYPAQNVIDYLNKLNPLLSQFLVARENWMHTAYFIDQLELDMAYAVDMDNEEGFKQIYFEYCLYVNAQKQFAQAMITLANKIDELGDPPSPFEEMRRARARYNEVFPKKKKLKGELGDCWIGTREMPNSATAGLGPLTEPLMRYLFTAMTDQGEMYFAIQLIEAGTTVKPETDADPAALYNIRVCQVECRPVKGQKPSVIYDGAYQKYFPNPPKMMISSLTMNLLYSFEVSTPTENDKKTPSVYAAKMAYHNAAGNFGNRVLRSGFFFKAALKWSQKRQWDKYKYVKGVIPQKALDDFAEAVREEFRIEESWKKLPKKQRKELAAKGQDPTAMPTEDDDTDQQAIKDSIEAEQKARMETIAEKKDLVEQLQNLINRERRIIYENQMILGKAGASEAEKRNARNIIKDCNYRIMHFQSDMSAEIDNIHTLQTGEFVHTRSAFDEYARNLMIHTMQVEAAKYDYSKKLASGIERQINLLPVEEREKARQVAARIVEDDGALVKGDYKKLLKLRNSINSKIVGHAVHDQAVAEEEIVTSSEKEFYVNCGIMACGALVGGLAPHAFATPTMTIGKFLSTGGALSQQALASAGTVSTVTSMVYGGMTGFAAAGGVHALSNYVAGKAGYGKEVGVEVFETPMRKAVLSGLGNYNIFTLGTSTFVDQFTDEENQGMPLEDRAWMAAKRAGTAMLLQYSMQKGVQKLMSLTTSSGNIKVQDKSGKLTAAQKRDILITKKDQLEAQDVIANYKSLEAARTKADWEKNTAEVARLDKELDQLAASMNSSFHAKHQLKYSTAPDAAALRARFDQRIQNIYKQEIPELTDMMASKGWNMSDVEWKQFRNASSVGSSSMDLDLGVISKSNNYVEPVFIKNGEVATAQEFLADAQNSLNKIHMTKYGISAKASEMNITNSAHPEAFATPAMLEKDFNWNMATPQELKSIPKVIDAKAKAIDGNIRFTETMKKQAKCRELSKEMENMLLPKYRENLKTLKPNSEKYKQVQKDLEYMTDMTERFKKIGTETTDPMEIYVLEQQLKLQTGGKGIQEVMSDVILGFDLKVP